jgi:predicted MFS family arabinose efflux permease
MPNIMLPDIMNQFQIDAAIFGQFSGVYYLGYALMHLPIGIMLDRYGPRKVMTICILLTSIGLLPILPSTNWIHALLGRTLIGIGSSAAILGTFKIIRMKFEEQHFTRMLSFAVTIGLIGAIYGGAPVSYLCQTFGYQMVAKGMTITGVIFALFTFFLVPETEQTVEKSSLRTDLKTVLGNPFIILFCAFAGLMVGPLEGFADVWGTEFFKKVYDMDPAVAASLPSMTYFGMCCGPLLSLIAEKTRSYLGTIIGAGVIMTASFLWMLFGQIAPAVLGCLLFLVGICCAYQIVAIYKASTYMPENVSGLTTAVANMIIMIFGYVFHAVIGKIVSMTGGINSAQAFICGISVIPIATMLGTLGFGFIALRAKKST